VIDLKITNKYKHVAEKYYFYVVIVNIT